MALDPANLNPTDEAILDQLHEGRVTISYLCEQTGYTQGNVGNRLKRLTEHGHVTKISQGLYELDDDPRD